MNTRRHTMFRRIKQISPACRKLSDNYMPERKEKNRTKSPSNKDSCPCARLEVSRVIEGVFKSCLEGMWAKVKPNLNSCPRPRTSIYVFWIL